MHILVINFTMDRDDPFLGHSPGWVMALCDHGHEVTVLTASAGYGPTVPGVRVIDIGWKRGRPLRNLTRTILLGVHALISYKFDAVFTHMAVVQSLIVAPITFLLVPNHTVWYAHASRPRALSLLAFFADEIVTASAGSCPPIKPPARVIGHAVEAHADPQGNVLTNKANLVTAGRLDKSKNLQSIADSVWRAREITGLDLRWTVIGACTSQKEYAHFAEMTRIWEDQGWLDWITVLPSQNPRALHTLLTTYSAFLHAFDGSLDKAPLEASLLGLPVISSNPELLREWGAWGDCVNLQDQLLCYLQMPLDSIQSETRRRQEIVARKHSLQTLPNRLFHPRGMQS